MAKRKYRDRIKSLRRVRASDLIANPKNWRTHPESQTEAMKGILSEVGWADAVLARETKDGIALIDGHLRKEIAPDEMVPVLILDVDEDEADKILLTHDPIAAMADANEQVLADLIDSIDTDSEELEAMLSVLSPDTNYEEVANQESEYGLTDYSGAVKQIVLSLKYEEYEPFVEALIDLKKKLNTSDFTETIIKLLKNEGYAIS